MTPALHLVQALYPHLPRIISLESSGKIEHCPEIAGTAKLRRCEVLAVIGPGSAPRVPENNPRRVAGRIPGNTTSDIGMDQACRWADNLGLTRDQRMAAGLETA